MVYGRSVRQPCNDSAPERDYIPPRSRLPWARVKAVRFPSLERGAVRPNPVEPNASIGVLRPTGADDNAAPSGGEYDCHSRVAHEYSGVGRRICRHFDRSLAYDFRSARRAHRLPSAVGDRQPDTAARCAGHGLGRSRGPTGHRGGHRRLARPAATCAGDAVPRGRHHRRSDRRRTSDGSRDQSHAAARGARVPFIARDRHADRRSGARPRVLVEASIRVRARASAPRAPHRGPHRRRRVARATGDRGARRRGRPRPDQ